MKAVLFLVFLLPVLLQTSNGSSIIRTVAGISPFRGDGKLAIHATLRNPYGVYVTEKNEVYISDSGNHVIRKIDKNGIISTVAGIPGEIGYSATDAIAKQTHLNLPTKIHFVEETNEIFICDTLNYAIRKILPGGIITTVAGGNGFGISDEVGVAKNVSIGPPNCVFVTPQNGEVFICDGNNHIIRKVFSNGTITTVVGIFGRSGYSGDGDSATNAKLNFPSAVYVTPQNEMYIADTKNSVIRKLYSNGTIFTIAGMGICQFRGDGNLARNAGLCEPRSVYVTQNDEIFIADSSNCAIRKIVNNTISTVAGSGEASCGYTGDYGIARSATMSYFFSIFISKEKEIYFADTGNNVIRKIGLDQVVIPIAGINMNKPEWRLSSLYSPRGIYVSKLGDIYIADMLNHVVKKVDKNGLTTIIAGVEGVRGRSGEGIPAINAYLNNPSSVYLDEETEELFIADTSNKMIRKVDSNGLITTVFDSNLSFPSAIFISKTKDMYIADAESHVVKKVFENGTIITVAGTGQAGISLCNGDGDLATKATLVRPAALFVTKLEELYIGDTYCQVIWKVFTNGTITSVVWGNVNGLGMFVNEFNELYFTSYLAVYKQATNGSITEVMGNPMLRSFSGDGRDFSKATFFSISSLFISPTGALYIADSGNNIVRKTGDLCRSYIFDEKLQISLDESTAQMNLLSKINRACVFNDDFDLEYLPLIKHEYKSTGEEWKTLVLDWNQQGIFQYGFSGQLLDIMLVKLDACSSDNSITSNCSVSTELGMIPTASSENFLLLPSITSTTFINFYKLSSLVSLLSISIQFNNTKTKNIDAARLINSGSSSVEIVGLQHSTIYNVYIEARVKYSNDLELRSVCDMQQIATEKGVPPSGSVQLLELLIQENSIVLTWLEIPMSLRGNLPLSYLEIEYAFKEKPAEKYFITIADYNADENIPNFYVISNLQYNAYYTFGVKVCSQIGCSNISSISAIIEKEEEDYIILIIFVVITLLLPLFCLMIVTIAALSILIIVRKIIVKYRKKESGIELLETLVSKDFCIEESKLDFSNSKVLGTGASGSVTTAKYFNIEVAVKMFPTTVLGLANDLEEFYNELRFMNMNTQHANIIRFFGVYTSCNFVGLVMEYCSNGTVANFISKNEISFTKKIEILRGIANGMQYLHHQDMAHRDLKCENVLLDSCLTPKIIDFGYSREIRETINTSLNLTMNIGTAAYCAPELIHSQATDLDQYNSLSSHSTNCLTEPLLEKHPNEVRRNNKVLTYDKKCDVYSFAIIIYVIYFRKLQPYGNISSNQIIYQLSKNTNTRPLFDESHVPLEEKWLIKLMQQCWSTDPSGRPSFEYISTFLNELH